eukprot:151317-Chlamydomonas_euryale.AAC.8
MFTCCLHPTAACRAAPRALAAMHPATACRAAPYTARPWCRAVAPCSGGCVRLRASSPRLPASCRAPASGCGSRSPTCCARRPGRSRAAARAMPPSSPPARPCHATAPPSAATLRASGRTLPAEEEVKGCAGSGPHARKRISAFTTCQDVAEIVCIQATQITSSRGFGAVVPPCSTCRVIVPMTCRFPWLLQIHPIFGDLWR